MIFFKIFLFVLAYFLFLFGVQIGLAYYLHLDEFPIIYEVEITYFISYLLLFPVILISAKRINSELESYSKITFSIFLAIIFSGVLLFIANDPIFRVEEIFGEIKVVDTSSDTIIDYWKVLLLFVNKVLLISIIEEVFFRKILLSYFFSSRNLLIQGVIFSNLLFALIHLNGIDSMVAAFFVGIISSIVYLNYGLVFSILLHGTYNLFWLLTKYNIDSYWSTIKLLDFGFFYWLIVFIAITGLLLFWGEKFKGFLSKMQ